MEKKNDFDFLKDRFDADGLQAPESLSAEEMKKKILEADTGVKAKQAEPVQNTRSEKPRRRYIWGSIGAAAACVVAVVIVGNTVMSPLGNFFAGSQAKEYGELAAGEAAESSNIGSDSNATAEAGTVADAGTHDQATGMISFSDYAELERKVSSMVPKEQELIEYEPYNTQQGFGLFSGSGSAAGKEAEIAIEDAAAPAAGAGSASSDTYTQVQGVDEADIVKTDDKYIYYTNAYNDGIMIVKASNGETKPVGEIDVMTDEPLINDFYLYGDILVAIGNEWDEKTDRDVTTAVIYDISDRAKPKKVNSYQQSGFLVSTRMVGQYLYLVTDYSFYYYGGGRYIPYVTGENGFDKMDIADICAFPDQENPSYVIAGAVDVTSGAHMKTRAKAVLGASEDIYCNTDNLFVAGYNYDYYRTYDYDVMEEDADVLAGDASGISAAAASSESTRILKISLNEGKIRFEASGMVPGRIDNQFAMDERDGYLRVATTSYDAHGYDINNLFVLDENLKQVGEVTGFAKDEHVEAVRYIGEKAYVITYEQTDPLFVIDVSDPTAPRIEGSVKIDGFSTLLVPADENTLFGIGHATATTKFGEVQEGIKLVTFDISDPSQPKVNDAEEYLNTSSEVQYNHKALLKNTTADYYAIPYNQYDDEDYYFEHGGVLVVRIQDGEIEVLKDYQDMDTEIRRCVYVGDYIYTIDADDEVGSFLME